MPQEVTADQSWAGDPYNRPQAQAKLDPTPTGSLTIIWAQEKAEIMRRLQALELYEVDGKREILLRLDVIESSLRQLIYRPDLVQEPGAKPQ